MKIPVGNLSRWKLKSKRREPTLRRRNCILLGNLLKETLGGYLWHTYTYRHVVRAIDPLNRIWDSDSSVGKHYHTFWWAEQCIEIPMDWYWREIETWELLSLRAELMLRAPASVDIGNLDF